VEPKDLRAIAGALARERDARKIYDFLVGILTPQERDQIALRWRLVRLLVEGMPQRDIAETLGVSLCKITRGSHELKHGPRGFRAVVEKAASKQTKGG
jgi:TrpR family transcriptional regulator, trp operon repressor